MFRYEACLGTDHQQPLPLLLVCWKWGRVVFRVLHIDLLA